MSQAKLTNIMPLILEAAKVVVEKGLKENVEYETYEISGEYTLKLLWALASVSVIPKKLASDWSINISDPNDEVAMKQALEHASSVFPQNFKWYKMVLMGLIPQRIRFALNMNIYSK